MAADDSAMRNYEVEPFNAETQRARKDAEQMNRERLKLCASAGQRINASTVQGFNPSALCPLAFEAGLRC